MKKGDIVKLKQGRSLADAMYNPTPQEQTIVKANQGNFFEITISERRVVTMCCANFEMIKFEEVPGEFLASNFEVVLESGEPDVEQLMREAEQQRLASVII